MTRADIITACQAEITRLQRIITAAERGPVMDWWQTDLVDWFEPQDRLCLASPDDGGELLPTRVYYRVSWDRGDDGKWSVVDRVERMQVFVELSANLPATDVTALLSEEMLAGYRDAACVDAEQKVAWREQCERAADDYYARMA